MSSSNRRTFLIGLGAAATAVGGAVAWLLARKKSPAPRVNAVPEAPPGMAMPDNQTVFPQRYAEALRAMTSRIYPDEPERAGAGATGAYDYIEREMRKTTMQGTRKNLLRGAVQLDRVAAGKFQKVFAKLAPEEQDTVIRALQMGEGKETRFEPQEFVRLMVALTLEGVFGDPVHGGNRGEAGWKAIGWNMQLPRPGRHHE